MGQGNLAPPYCQKNEAQRAEILRLKHFQSCHTLEKRLIAHTAAKAFMRFQEQLQKQ